MMRSSINLWSQTATWRGSSTDLISSRRWTKTNNRWKMVSIFVVWVNMEWQGKIRENCEKKFPAAKNQEILILSWKIREKSGKNQGYQVKLWKLKFCKENSMNLTFALKYRGKIREFENSWKYQELKSRNLFFRTNKTTDEQNVMNLQNYRWTKCDESPHRLEMLISSHKLSNNSRIWPLHVVDEHFIPMFSMLWLSGNLSICQGKISETPGIS